MPCTFGRTFLLLAGTTSFFFLNIYLIFTYIQMQHHATFQEKPVQQPIVQEPEVKLCNPTDSLAQSALKRAKVESCKARIREAACQLEEGTFHDVFPESNCSNHDHLLVNLRVGCFADSANGRTLSGFTYQLKEDNSHERCRNLCYKTGHLYYGLEYKQECFCGDSINAVPTLPNTNCTAYSCPGNPQQFCGGYNAIEVFRTGLKEKYTWPKAKYVHRNESTPNGPVKIFFLLQLNGRNDRQVKRMLRNIYSPNHIYYIHVDKRQKYMQYQMRKVAAQLPNVFMAPFAHSTIWGGASLLTMVQEAMRDALSRDDIGSWDYFINLSESDFSVMPLSELEDQLRSNMGKSFLASHGYNVGNFVKKQGFDFVFVECEEHMWRIGKRPEFPANLRIDGGSDWLVLHHDLVEYSLSSDELPTKLRKLFESIILPVESFYHTLAYNSHFCHRVLTGNLRMTNWMRKQGCRCEKLKKIVDWCGCSPLVIRKDTTIKFTKQKAHERPFYFARKFESLIDIDAIAKAEEQSMGEGKELEKLKSHPSYSSTFVNVFSKETDGEDENVQKLVKSLLSIGKLDQFKSASIESVDLYKADSTATPQLVFSLQNSPSDIVQLLVNHIDISSKIDSPIINGHKLESAAFGMSIDHKEEIFRDHLGYSNAKSTSTIRLKWHRVPDLPTSVDSNWTSPQSSVSWRNAKGEEKATQQIKPYNSIWGTQFTDVSFKKKSILF
ncbi:hypothetical protein WR25_05819 [Diploscapter pachys]|uniref:protein xylosyltransferase n=1 Tax=Diploscapter pachys TaxID=2018661 RepID=A0A2A2M1M3_9BILA|nr:hypothetical protein WR25_05819 [Diploscapter pachys]